MIFVGIDVSKTKHDCCIINSNGSILTDSLRIDNSKEGFETLYSVIISTLKSKDISKVKIGLESTGHYSTNITNYLYSNGFEVHTLNPLATNLFRKAGTLRKTKTDKTDAKVIATMLFSDESKSYSPVSYHIQELKSLTRHRYRMIGYRSKLKISVTRLIDIIFPELPDLFWSIHQASSYALLLELPTPNVIKLCHLTKLTNIISTSSKGKYGKEKAITLKEFASNSIGSANRSVAFELQQTIRLIQSVQSEIGSTYLRWAILQAARLVPMRDATFSAYLAKKRSEGKHFNVVRSHVGKKLLRVIFYLLKNNTAFVPQM